MSLLPLCHEPHPVLRTPARPVAAFTQELKHLSRDMIETMYDRDGIGLAAPQVGCDLQLFIANPTQERGREVVLANPVLEIVRGRTSIVEGCLSLPNIWERVRRASHVRMSGRDVSGRPVTIDADGLLAIILQHEYDHLQGRLLIDRLSWFRRRRLGARARRSAAT